MKTWLAAGLGLILSLTSNALLALEPNSTGFGPPTNHPQMSILKGKVLLVDMNGKQQIDATSIFKGTSYAIVKYKGSSQLIPKISFVVNSDKDISPITNLDFFKQFDKQHTGTVPIQDLVAARLALASYNALGYLTIESIENFGISALQYNIDANAVDLFTATQRNVLAGGIYEFKR